MSDGRCIHCGQKGHYSMMCPKKPSTAHYEPEFEDGQRRLGGGGLNMLLVNGKRRRFSFGKRTF